MIQELFPMTIGEEEVLDERRLLTGVEDGEFMPAGQVRYLILHCSATRCNCDYTVKQLMRDHKARGFQTIGYHFYIRKDGTLTQHRRLLEVGAHCRPFNRCSIGICYEGGLNKKGCPADTRTPQQIERMRELLQILHKLFPHAVVRGHRDMPGTVPKGCPCFDVVSFMQEGVF